MNVLMLGRWLPVPRRPGLTSRASRFAREVAHHHRATLAFITDEPDLAGAVASLRTEFDDLEFATVPRGWKCLSSAVRLATGESCTLAYFRSEALARRLADRMRTRRYDAVWVASSSMIPYALELPATVPIIMDFGAIDSEWWRQQAAERAFPGASFFRTEAAKLRLAETAIGARAARCVVSSWAAARALAAFAPDLRPEVIPDGVDTEHYVPIVSAPPGAGVLVPAPSSLGADLERLTDFCNALAPLVRAEVPGVEFVIAPPGNGPTPVRIAGMPGVHVTHTRGDLRPFLQRATVALAPFGARDGRAEGVLEAMATGVPVVTAAGAADDLRAVAGRALYLEDEPVAMARRLVELLRNPELRAHVGYEGCRFVRAHRSWAVLARRAVGLLDTAPKVSREIHKPIVAQEMV